MHNPSTCSELARSSGEELAGTAPAARAYLLVEFNGPWPAKAFEDNGVDPEAGQRIAQRAAAADVRPLFIRRPGSAYAPEQREFAWAYVDALAGVTNWHAPASLGVIAQAPWPDEASVAREPELEPTYLVCTHGRRDQCCATQGRPVAVQFARLRPEHTWECSHVGGHRWAANVVVLPSGQYYGFAEPDDVPAVIDASERGEVFAPLWRGTSSDAPQVQAAKAMVAGTTGHTALDAWGVVASTPDGDDCWTVSLAQGDQPPTVVRVTRYRIPATPNPCAPNESKSTVQWSAEVLPPATVNASRDR